MNCIKCGNKLNCLELYCFSCGEKVKTELTFDFYEENEDNFAFHSEYYGKDNIRFYHLYFSNYRDNIYYKYKDMIIKLSEGGNTEWIYLDKKIDNYNSYHAMAVNRRGIYLFDNPCREVLLLNEQGQLQHSIRFNSKLNINCFYIYDDKVYAISLGKENDEWSYQVIEYYMEEGDTARTIWNLSQVKEHITEIARKKLYAEMAGDKDPKTITIKLKSSEIDCKYLYANKQKVISSFTIYINTDEGEEVEFRMTICIDLLSLKWNIIEFYIENPSSKQELKNGLKIFSFDMLRNRMWYSQYQENKEEYLVIKSIGIRRLIDITEQETENSWKLPLEFLVPDIIREKNIYFDGKNAYQNYDGNFFYTYNNIGEKWEWNQSCHGAVQGFKILGSWMYVGLDYSYPFYPNANRSLHFFPTVFGKLPDKEQWLTIQKEAFEAYDKNRINNISKADSPVLGNPNMERFYSNETDKLKETKKDDKLFIYCSKCGEKLPNEAKFCCFCGESINIKKDMEVSLNKFRILAKEQTYLREDLLNYRNSLDNRWDYNTFVGILLAVRSSKHGDEVCKNFAIGQGDNNKSVIKNLEAKGLAELFEKYKGKYVDEDITVNQVEDEIISLVPEYAPIRKQFNKIVFEKNDIWMDI